MNVNWLKFTLAAMFAVISLDGAFVAAADTASAGDEAPIDEKNFKHHAIPTIYTPRTDATSPAEDLPKIAASMMDSDPVAVRTAGLNFFDSQDNRRSLTYLPPMPLPQPEFEKAAAASVGLSRLEPGVIRLYDTLHPENYTIKINVNPDVEKFTGQIRLLATVAKETRMITLHAVDLVIAEAYVNGRKIDSNRIGINREAETITLLPDQPLLPGEKVLIDLKYSGNLNHQMHGLYQSKGKYQGRNENYIFTKFEPTYFRRMVPSIDEPEAKATFNLTVTVPEELTALSNMPATDIEHGAGTKTVTFGQTPKMSTYLVALAAARLESRSRMVEKTKVSVWASPEMQGQTEFALDAAERSLRYLNKYFGINYQLPKLDLIAVPDFATAAMENWGALTFKDTAIFFDPKLSSIAAKRTVARVVAHEIVHQWIGNLVTMKWWNDLWLNEAFAEWISYKVLDQWRPGWNNWLEFNDGKATALSIDALKHTRPISSTVRTPAEIEAQSDALTYEKGAAVLRMIEEFLGEETFRKGLQNYIREHKYGNTEAKDLWVELEEVSHQPVSKMANDWFTQPGYPIVSIEAISKDNRKIKLTQHQFAADGSYDSPARWTIPMNIEYHVAGEEALRTKRLLMKDGQMEVDLPANAKIEWIYPNQGEIGYYRSEVKGRLFDSIQKAAATQLSPAERVGLLYHAWSNAKSGTIPIDSFMNLLEKMKGDRTRVTLEEEGAYLRAISDDFIHSDEDRAHFQRFAENILDSHWKRLGWDASAKHKESDETKLARAAVLSAYRSITPTPRMKAQILTHVKQYMKNPSSIDSTLVSPLLTLGAMTGDARLFEQYRQKFNQAKTPAQGLAYLRAMAHFSQPEIEAQVLNMTLTDQIRGQDTDTLLSIMLGTPKTQALAWEFTKRHWPQLKKKMGSSGSTSVIDSTSSLWSGPWRNEILRFFSDPNNRIPAADRTLDQTLESIDLGLKSQAQGNPLSQWLEKYSRRAKPGSSSN